MEYVSVAEAARYLGITEHAVRQRAQRGTLPSHRGGGKVLIGIEQDQATREVPDEQSELLGEQLADIPREPDENIRFLREQNARLTGMIESMQRDHARQISELHVLLQNTQRLILATIPDAPQAPERPGDDVIIYRMTSGNTPHSAPQREPAASQPPRSWWRRLLDLG